MTLVDLTNRENELLQKVKKTVGFIEEKNVLLEKEGIFDDYKKVFNGYVGLHKKDLEALKRCLFLYWHSTIEPSFSTGLGEFDNNQVRKVLSTLNRRLSQGITDNELEWMLSYYSSWGFIFDPFPEFQFIHEKLNEKNKAKMPDQIDQIEMEKRGQMGTYWNSLTRFKKNTNN